MGLFYPGTSPVFLLVTVGPLTIISSADNPKRMTRVHQLADSITNMQANLKDIAKQMDDENAKCRPAINALLKARGMSSVDDVINAAAAKLTPDERKVFEAVSSSYAATVSLRRGADVAGFPPGSSLRQSRIPRASVRVRVPGLSIVPSGVQYRY